MLRRPTKVGVSRFLNGILIRTNKTEPSFHRKRPWRAPFNMVICLVLYGLIPAVALQKRSSIREIAWQVQHYVNDGSSCVTRFVPVILLVSFLAACAVQGRASDKVCNFEYDS